MLDNVTALTASADAPQSPPVEQQRELGATAALLSELSYKYNDNLLERHARKLGYRLSHFSSKNLHAILLANANDIWVAFEGSSLSSTDDYMHNLHHTRREHPLGGYVHEGFSRRQQEPLLKSSSSKFSAGQPIIDAVHQRICDMLDRYPNAMLHFTGHSSGGVAAILQAAHLAHNDMISAACRVNSITTFGQPRVGNEAFYASLAQFYTEKYTRYVLPHDPITALPPGYNGAYTHGGNEILLAQAKPQETRFRQNIAEAQGGTSLPSVVQKMNPLHHYRRVHSIGSYYRALLAPSGVSSKGFIRKLYEKGHMESLSAPIQAAEATPLFDDKATEFCLHLADVLEFTRDSIGHSLYEARIAPAAHALRSAAYTRDKTQAEAALYTQARMIEPLIKSVHNDELVPLRAFLRDIRMESAKDDPLQNAGFALMRHIQDTLSESRYPDAVTHLTMYEDRLYSHLSDYQETGSRQAEERVGFIAKNIDAYLASHVSRDASLKPLREHTGALLGIIKQRKHAQETAIERQ